MLLVVITAIIYKILWGDEQVRSSATLSHLMSRLLSCFVVEGGGGIFAVILGGWLIRILPPMDTSKIAHYLAILAVGK